MKQSLLNRLGKCDFCKKQFIPDVEGTPDGHVCCECEYKLEEPAIKPNEFDNTEDDHA